MRLLWRNWSRRTIVISIEMDKCVTNGCIFSSLTGIQFSPGEDGRECGALNQPANRDLPRRLTIYEFSTLYISVRSCRILVFAAFTCIVAAPIKCLNNKLLTYTVNSPSVCTDVQFTPFTQNFFVFSSSNLKSERGTLRASVDIMVVTTIFYEMASRRTSHHCYAVG